MNKQILTFLWRYLKRKSPLLLALLVSSLFAVVCQIFIPLVIGIATDQLFDPQAIQWTQLIQTIIWLIILAIMYMLAQYLLERLANNIAYQLMYDLRQEMFQKIHQLPLSYLDSHSHGDLVSRLVNDVDLIGTGFIQSFKNLFTAISLVVGILVMMLLLNIKVALIILIFTPISVLVSSIIANRTYKYFQKQMNLRGDLNAYVEEMTIMQSEVRGFNYQSDTQAQLDQMNQELHKSGVVSQFYGALINPTSRIINALIYAGIGLFGAFEVMNGHLSVGIFTSFLNYAKQFSKPFDDISSIINELQTALAASQRIEHFLSAEISEKEEATNSSITFNGEIVFDNVAFSYQPNKPLIREFNLEVSAGETVAIVGPTGAGKSTLINLLMRFYSVDRGEIFYDHLPSQQLSLSTTRQAFGMVLQDPWIFAGTVHDNIAYGNPKATREEVVAVAKQAQLDPMIQQMDDQYDTWLEEDGANLSNGQKQLICIARIMLTHPEMLILDEATSAIDVKTEAAIQENFDQLMENRTSFIVAHRLATIQSADMILYMADGEVKEQGTHQELLARQGDYAKLYNSQFNI
ncbi:MAG: ABC transporter ATP-binding protein [Aerococcus suis]|nr:ABC transporter ATP-binding protein [Aerococcus suis]